MWLSNTSAKVKVYIRSIGFVWSGTAATAFPTSPRITIERVTFTGTPSGAAITPAKRDSTDAANTATLNTVSTGLNVAVRSEEHTSELQSRPHLVCRLLLV